MYSSRSNPGNVTKRHLRTCTKMLYKMLPLPKQQKTVFSEFSGEREL